MYLFANTGTAQSACPPTFCACTHVVKRHRRVCDHTLRCRFARCPDVCVITRCTAVSPYVRHQRRPIHNIRISSPIHRSGHRSGYRSVVKDRPIHRSLFYKKKYYIYIYISFNNTTDRSPSCVFLQRIGLRIGSRIGTDRSDRSGPQIVRIGLTDPDLR